MTDHNENDDFNHIETEEGESHTPQGFRGNLTEAWRTKPLFKLFVVIVVLGSVVGVVSSMLSTDKQSTIDSHVVPPPDLHSPNGGTQSIYMKQQTDLADKKREEEALKNGGSAMKTVSSRVTDIDDLGRKNDPLAELRTETERLKKELVTVQQKQQQPVVVQQPPAQQQAKQQQDQASDDALAQAMQHQMGVLAEQWKPRGIKDISVTIGDMATAGTTGGNVQGGVNAAGTGAAATADASAIAAPPKIIIPAGTVNYGQLLTEANSDVPGPIMAQIMSGPFAGSRAVGSFQTKNDYLVLQFTLVNSEGKDFTINAYALDPNTTLAGMATEVDERYFVRVVLPAAAGFLDGLGSALAQGDTSVTTNGSVTITTQGSQGFKQGMYKGLGEAANTAGTFFRDQANQTKPLVRVASGTPLGLFFVSSVKDTDANRPPVQTNANANGNGSLLGMRNQLGYPGAVIPGYGAQQQSDGSIYNSSNAPSYGNNYGSSTSGGLPTQFYPGMTGVR